MDKNTICKIFVKEFDRLSKLYPEIILTTLDMLEKLPNDRFWVLPASSTGVHHPKTSNCYGGNVVHTKQAFWICNSLLEMESNMHDKLKAVTLIAILLHDLDKFTESVDGHGVTGSEKIIKYIIDSRTIFIPELELISKMVMYHMGKWGSVTMDRDHFIRPAIMKLCDIVHLADYLSSRPFLEFNEGETG